MTDPTWKEAARNHLEAFCRKHKDPFLTEEVRKFAEEHGLAAPHDARAWGGVIRLAADDNVIRRIGYHPARSSNMSPKCLWVANG